MPIILVAGVGLSVLLLAFTMQGMQGGSPYWLKALLNAFAHPQGSFLKRTALKALAPLAHGVAYIYHACMHAFSVAASHSIHAATQWVDGLAGWVTHVVTATAELAEETAQAFERLSGQTIPRAIHKATAVIHHGIDALEHDLARLHARLRALERGIDRLITHRVLPAIRAAERAIAVTIPKELGRIRARERALERDITHPTRAWLKRVWTAGWILVGAGLMLKFLTRKFPYLFCRNTTRAAKALCGWDSVLLDALLLDAVVLTGTLSVVEFAEALQAVEGEVLQVMSLGIKELGEL